MIKSTAFFIVILFAFSTSKAQEWGLYKGDTVHYLKQELYNFGAFNQSNTFGLTVLVDTSFSTNSTNTVIFKKGFSDAAGFSSSNNCAALTSSIFGDSLLYSSNHSTFYIDSNIQLHWFHNTNSWVFYSDTSNNQLSINVDSTTTNGTDSIRYYSFVSNASPNHDLHQFDSAQIILSKNRGMLKGFDFSDFPDTLIVLDMFEVGPITNRDVFDLEVGDEYHYIESSDNFYQGIQLNDKYIVKVLNKIVHSADSVSYQMEKTISDEYRMITQGHVTKSATNYKDTIWASYQLDKMIDPNVFLDSSDIGGNGVGFYNDQFIIPTLVSVGSSTHPIYSFHQNQLCNFFFEHDRYTEYVFGIGSFTHTLDIDMGRADYYHENLLYYKKGNKTWGNPLNIVVGLKEKEVQNIEIYPNPVDHLLTIKGLSSSWQYEMINSSGQIIEEGELSSGEGYIPVNKLHPGTYFINFFLGDKHFIKKIIVK